MAGSPQPGDEPLLPFGFGNLDPSLTMREVIPAVVLLALGTQTIFASFFISILSIDRD